MAVAAQKTVEYRAVWTCNNSLPGGEEHVMDDVGASSLSELADEYTFHFHGNCMECEAYNAFYEGDLDRVEKIRGEEVVEEIDGEAMVEEHGMSQF